MKIDLKSLGSSFGRSIEFDYDMDLSYMDFYGEKPLKSPVHTVGTIVNRHGIVSLNAEMTASYQTVCSKCLKPLDVPLKVEVNNILAKSAENDDNDEIFIIDSDVVELDDILIPALVLNVDMAYYCDEDCKGLCMHCGADLNNGDCTCNKKEIDPRLAVLAKLLEGK